MDGCFWMGNASALIDLGRITFLAGSVELGGGVGLGGGGAVAERDFTFTSMVVYRPTCTFLFFADTSMFVDGWCFWKRREMLHFSGGTDRSIYFIFAGRGLSGNEYCAEILYVNITRKVTKLEGGSGVSVLLRGR